MNYYYLNKFIDCIEQIVSDYYSNPRIIESSYDTNSSQQMLLELIADAKRLINYCEGEIALENLLENMLELKMSVYIDRDVLNLAQYAFGNTISTKNKRLLKAFMDRFCKYN